MLSRLHDVYKTTGYISLCFVADESQTLDKQIPMEELKKLLQQQLEYYFSR